MSSNLIARSNSSRQKQKHPEFLRMLLVFVAHLPMLTASDKPVNTLNTLI